MGLLLVLLSHVCFLFSEMHRTQTEFENQLIFKVFVFQFVNFYSSIIYIGFFKGRYVLSRCIRKYFLLNCLKDQHPVLVSNKTSESSKKSCDLVKYRSRGIAADMHVKFHSDRTIVNTNLVISRSYSKTSGRILKQLLAYHFNTVHWGPEAKSDGIFKCVCRMKITHYINRCLAIANWIQKNKLW